jgi:hypothetical protein
MSATAPSKLILCMSASLDGFLAREVGVIDWLAEAGEGAAPTTRWPKSGATPTARWDG